MAKTTTQPAQYDAGQIQVLKGLEAVRKRPGMYIGSTSERGLHHLVYEVVDNSIDEALAGYATHVEVTIHADNSITVVDDGRGIPVDIHPVEKIPGVELAITVLHAGGKFDKSSYKVSGGLHGVGVSVVNALSEQLKVWVRRDGKEYYMDFVRGDTTTKLKVAAQAAQGGDGHHDLVQARSHDLHGARLPVRHARVAAARALVPQQGRDDHAHGRARGSEEDGIFLAKGGLKEFVQLSQREPQGAAQRCRLHRDGARRHRDRSRAPVQRRLQRERLLLREQHQHARGRHAPHRLQVGAHARDQRLRHEGQLAQEGQLHAHRRRRARRADGGALDQGARAAVRGADEDQARQLGSRGRREDGRQRVARGVSRRAPASRRTSSSRRRCRRRARARRRARRAISRARSRRSTSAICPASSPTARSAIRRSARSTSSKATRAGGSAKLGRNRQFQAILPLRGKIINVEKARIDKVLSNEEIRTIITAIGTGIKDDFSIENARYHKIIIMTDADVDGAHIRTLLLTFFYPPDAGADRGGIHLHRAAAALSRGKGQGRVLRVR